MTVNAQKGRLIYFNLMSDWEVFVAEMPWIVEPGTVVEVGESRAWGRAAVEGLPELSTLLAGARVTPVVVGAERFEVLAWGSGEALRGWLGPEPVDIVDVEVHPVHRELLSRFGGIGEVIGAPRSWWSPNHPEILTADVAGMDLVETIHAYRWIWENDELEVPIRAEDFYVVSREANGNLTIAERDSGRLLLFAPDHSYDGVSVLDGCPEYSLYTIDGVEGLVDWIEGEARAWAAE